MIEKLTDLLLQSISRINWNLINSNRELKARIKHNLEGTGVELVGIGSTSPKAGNGYLIVGGLYYEFRFSHESVDVWEL
jgi:hypothetical protein